MHWDDVYGELLPIEDCNQPIYNLAFRFWDDWCDCANHEWKYHETMQKFEWPLFAREIAIALRTNTMPSNQRIIDQFLPKPKVSNFKKIKDFFKKG
jgi:hypothetical protein